MKNNNLFRLCILILLMGQSNQQLANSMAMIDQKPLQSKTLGSNKETLLKQHLQKTVANNVFWARLYIISELADLPDKNAIKERLLKNQEIFGKILTSFYGKDASDKLTKLLREHKNFTVQLLTAVKLNNKKQIKKIEANWYQNIKELAVFLNKLNPKLPVTKLTDMLNGLLKLTKKEMVLRATKQWKADIQNFDAILKHASQMADIIADGLIQQMQQQSLVNNL